MVAFQRVYGLALKKRLNPRNIFISLIIILSGIPLKFLGIFYGFIFKSSGDFRDYLENLYLQSYTPLRGAKIEILNGRIYLNCFTVGKLLTKLRPNNLSDQQILDLLKDLKSLSADFKKYEYKGEFIKMSLGEFTTSCGVPVSKHILYKEGPNLMHSTSNIDFKLGESQEKDIAINALVKEGALSPGTVITKGHKNLIIYDYYKKVSAFEINSIRIGHPLIFKLDTYIYRYMYDKDVSYRSFISTHLRNNGFDESIIKELRTNCYTNSLEILNEYDMIDEISRFRNNND